MKRCLAGLCLLLMLLTACTAGPSQPPVTAKDDAARRAWLEQQGWQTEEQPLSLRRRHRGRGHHGLGGKRLSGIPPLSGGEHIEKREEGSLPLPPIFQYSSPSVMICDHSTGPTAPVGSKPSCRWRVSTAC